MNIERERDEERAGTRERKKERKERGRKVDEWTNDLIYACNIVCKCHVHIKRNRE